jgi:hypothetical protein
MIGAGPALVRARSGSTRRPAMTTLRYFRFDKKLRHNLPVMIAAAPHARRHPGNPI